MLAKYLITIGENEYEFTSRHLRNWADVTCAYSRKDHNGVIRSYSTKFEFVGEAYDLLFSLYKSKGLTASATITVRVITERWGWTDLFSAPLDFSTISWDGIALSISAVDNTLASYIKAHKSTKYEFVVGQDIISDNSLEYDRIEMQNSAVHEVMCNTPQNIYDDGRVMIRGNVTTRKRLPVYVVGDPETFEGNPILYEDDDAESGSCFLKLVKSVPSIKMRIDLSVSSFDNIDWNTDAVNVYLCRFTDGHPDYDTSYVTVAHVVNFNKSIKKQNLGLFSSLEALKAKYPNPPQDAYAVIGKSTSALEAEAVYYTPVINGSNVEWYRDEHVITDGNTLFGNVISEVRRYITDLELKDQPTGAKYTLMYTCQSTPKLYDAKNETAFFAINSKIETFWTTRANPISIDALSPRNVAQKLVDKIVDGNLNTKVHISLSNWGLNRAWLFAAESIRGIKDAKLYTTFGEFCDWMSTVFGFVYRLGDRTKSPWKGIVEIDSFSNGDYPPCETTVCPASQMSDKTLYSHAGVIVYNSHDGKFYNKFPGSEQYNDPATGKARTDMLFRTSIGQHIVYVENNDIKYYDGNIDAWDKDVQDIYFCPRSEIFASQNVIDITGARDFEFSVDNSMLYSSVEIGYDKHDYEAKCGRDEFNFYNTYDTGLTVTDKKLSMKSKYRADCYGFEFTAQKRSDDSSDSTTDNDVFFVHCKKDTKDTEDDTGAVILTDILKVYRMVELEGVLSNTVFNAEYEPRQCLVNNAAYIAAMKAPMTFRYTSGEGNKSVICDDIPFNSGVTVAKSLFTAGVLTFNCAEVAFPYDTDALYRVSHDGVTYTGFLLDMSVNFTQEEATKYKLIVKSIEQ